MKVAGLDLSLTGAGVATALAGPSGAPSATVTQYGSKPTSDDLAARSLRLKGIATAVIRDCLGADLVLVEDMFIPTRTTAGAILDRCGLWWLTIASLTSRGIPVLAVPNNTMKMYVLGKGGGKGTDKDYMLAAVVRRYPDVNVQSNNEADALVLAAMGARWLGCPLEASHPDTHLRAMAAVKWPQITR